MTTPIQPKKLDMNEASAAFERLLGIMNDLREKCPWDREQTLDSIRTNTIEETYELSDAIINKKMHEVQKELGDLLLHVVFYSKIGSETGDFDITDVINGICNKLIYRHPHVYGQTKADGTEQVLQNWEQLKLKEKDGNKTVLSGVPKSLPALIKAIRVQEKARAVGFDWEQREQVWDKVNEELNEFRTEVDGGDMDKMEMEFGDFMFALVNTARLYGINPETALERTNQKFIRRFNYLESKTIKQGHSLKDMTLAEMDVIWDEAKKMELNGKLSD